MNLRDATQVQEATTIVGVRQEGLRIVASDLTGGPGIAMGPMGLTYTVTVAQYYGLQYATKEGTIVEGQLIYG